MAKNVPAATLSVELVIQMAQLQDGLNKAKKMMEAVSGDIAKNAKATNDNLAGIGRGAGAGLQQFSKDVVALKAQLDPAWASMQRYKEEIALAQKALQQGAITHAQYVEAVRKSATAAGFLADKQALAAAAAEREAAAVRQAALAAEEAARAQAGYAAQANALRAQLDPMFAAQQRFNQQLDLADTLYAKGAITTREYAQAQQLARDTLQKHATAVAGSSQAMDRSNMVMLQTGKSAGSVRLGMQQLSFQMNDVATQFAAGTPPMIIFAQQSGQVIQALGLMSNGAKGLLGFLGGPWGLVLTSALVVLTPFVAKLWETKDAAKATEKSLDNMASAAARSAHALTANKAIADRAALLDERTRLGGPTSQGQAFFANTKRGRDIEKQIALLDKQIGSESHLVEIWNQRAEVAGRQDKLNDRIAASTSKITAATQAHDAALKLLNDQRVAGVIGDEEYVRQGIALQKQLEAVEHADRNAAAATRANAKAAREAAKAQQEYYKSVAGGAALRGLRNMGSILSPGGIEASLKVSNRSMADELKRRQDEWHAWMVANAEEDRQAQKKADDESRARAIDAANDVADIVGGRIGSAIAELGSALDRMAEVLAKARGKNNSGFLKISKELGDKLAAAGAGAQIGSAVSGIMKGLGIKTSSTGAQLGGAVGGAFGGPLGAIAGSILGGVVGGMLKSVKKASATIEIAAGKAVQTSLSGNSSKLTKVAGAMADSLIAGLGSIADQLGGSLGNGIKVSIGQRDKTFRVDLQGLGRTKGMPKFDTEQEAVAFAIQSVIQQGAIVGLRAGTEALLKGQGDLEAQLQKALSFENVFRELEARSNPLVASMKALDDEFAKLLDVFEEAKASTEDYAKLQELLALKQKELTEQAFAPLRSMLDDLKGQADEAGSAVRSAFESVLSRETDAIGAYQAAVTAQAEAQRQVETDAMRDRASVLRDEAKGYADAAAKLREFASSIFGVTAGTVRFSMAAVMSAAMAGDVSALQAQRDAAISSSGTRAQMNSRLASIRAAANGAAGGLEGRASAAERQAQALEDQLAAVQDVADSTASIEDLLKNMLDAKAAADIARAQMAKLGELTETEMSFADAVAGYEKAKAARDDLIRDITAAGFAGLIDQQAKTGSELLAAVSAVSGMATSALSTLSANASAIQTAQAAAVNDNPWMTYDIGYGAVSYRSAPAMGGMAADIGQALAAEVVPVLRQIAKTNATTANTLEDWDRIGQPDTRDVA
jgi:hypothetical protein